MLWLLVALGIVAPLAVRSARGRSMGPVLASGLALIGGLALRIVVIFGAQV